MCPVQGRNNGPHRRVSVSVSTHRHGTPGQRSGIRGWRPASPPTNLISELPLPGGPKTPPAPVACAGGTRRWVPSPRALVAFLRGPRAEPARSRGAAAAAPALTPLGGRRGRPEGRGGAAGRGEAAGRLERPGFPAEPRAPGSQSPDRLSPGPRSHRALGRAREPVRAAPWLGAFSQRGAGAQVPHPPAGRAGPFF